MAMATSTYAIVETGGKQYRAEKGASLVVEHLRAGEGDKVTLRAVMYRGDKDVVVDGSELEKVKVEADERPERSPPRKVTQLGRQTPPLRNVPRLGLVAGVRRILQ